MTKYVAGFFFSEDKKRVVLIEKKRPTWQIGKLNGVGGHVEENETPEAAMSREFFEETGVSINSWKSFVVLGGVDWSVNFFYAIGPVDNCDSTTDEDIKIVDVDNLPMHVVGNLHWLIPLALDLNSDVYESVYVSMFQEEEVK